MNNSTERAIDDEILDVGLLLAKVLNNIWWAVAITVISALAFGAWAFLQTPIYRATTILAPAGESGASGVGSALGQIGGIAALAGLTVGSQDAETEEALAVLKSRQFTESFIRDRNLMPRLFADKWDSKNAKWLVGPSSGPSLATGYRYFDKNIRSVSSDKKAGLVTLQVDWRDREEGAEWANDLVRRLNEEMRSRVIKDANTAVSYLEQEAATTSTLATREAIGRLIEAQVKRRMMANVMQEFSFRVIDPALPADDGYPVRPNKVALIVLGALLGAAVGALFAVFLSIREEKSSAGGLRRREPPPG